MNETESESPLDGLDPAACGERIESLLEASAAAGPIARERAEELVRLVTDLYGAGLERLMELAYDAGALSDELLASLAQDELVSGLLAVHGLHPYSLEDRVEQALESVRPYLDSHNGDMRVVDISPDGVVKLHLLGSCDGCASSAVTLQATVEGAIRAAAPEVIRIDVEPSTTPIHEAPHERMAGVIPITALSSRIKA